MSLLINRVSELRRIIEKHNYYYYTLDSPRISDGEFDKLFRDCLLYTSDAADE